MRWIRNFTVILILMWIVGACLKQPENSIVPQIQLQSVTFKNEFQSTGKPDTLIVNLKFTDGDGDLGLDGVETAVYTSATDSTDINSPYYYFYDTTKNTIWYYTHNLKLQLPKTYRYVNYASHRKIHTHPFDTLPSAVNCKNWEFRPSPADTLYIQNNPYNNNFYMDIYIKNPNGTYTYFDITTLYPLAQCTPNAFNGRFPILASDLGKKSSLDGTITYKYQSAGLYILFRTKTIKLKIYILDRSFHKSNVVESDDIIIK